MRKALAVLTVLFAAMVVSGCVTPEGEPAYYLAEKAVSELVVGDEVVVGSETYTFQGIEEVPGASPEDGYYFRLVMTDSGGNSVQSTVNSTGAMVNVKVPLPAGQPAPAPAAPPPVSIPVPVPYSPPSVPAAPTPTLPPAPPAPTPTPVPVLPNVTNVTNVTPAPTPTPTPAVCGNSIVESGEQCEPPNTATCDANCMTIIPIPYPPHCYNSAWDGDESDFNCGGSCPACPPVTPFCDDVSNNPYYPLPCSSMVGCWVNADCTTGNCDMSGAQPLPATDPVTSTVYSTIQQLRVLAGQGWIVPYSGICR